MLYPTPLSFHGASALDWLWDERPREQVPARPLSRNSGETLSLRSSTPRSTPRAALGRAVVSVPTTSCQNSPAAGSNPLRGSPFGESLCQSSRPSKEPRKRLQKGRHRTSGVTLAEAAASGAIQVSLWRGLEQQRAIENAQQEAAEFAKYRRDCKAAWASEDRAQAAQWLKSQLRLAQMQQMQDIAEQQDSCLGDLQQDQVGDPQSPRASMAPPRLRASTVREYDEISESRLASSRGKSFSLEAKFERQISGRESVSSSGSFTPASAAQRWGACRASVLAVEATGRLTRGLPMAMEGKAQESKTKKLGRMSRLLEARKQKFECLPDAEKERLRRAFNNADKDDKQCLGMSQLRMALAELGISSREPAEKEVLLMMVRDAIACGPVSFLDFVFQVVPKVEHKLSEVKSPKLFQIFNQIDTQGNARISYAECVEALRRHADSTLLGVDEKSQARFWNTFARELPNTYKEWKAEDDTVDFAGFQSLAHALDSSFSSFKNDLEHTAAVHLRLPPKLEEAHFGEICRLRDIFRVYDPLWINQMSYDYGFLALMDCGALPIAGAIHLRVSASFEQSKRESMMKFVDFLGYVDSFRKEERVSRETALHALFTVNGWPSDRKLAISEMPQTIIELNFINDCGLTATTLRPRVLECNKDGQETFTLEESLELIGRVIELARTSARQKENKVASELEMETEHVLHFRKSFGQMTHSGVIGQLDIRRIIEEMHPDVVADDDTVRHVLEEAARGEFYDVEAKFKRSDAKMALEGKTANKPPETLKAGTASKGHQAQSDAARAIAEEEAAMLKKVLENVVLCFDAYIRVVVHLLEGL